MAFQPFHQPKLCNMCLPRLFAWRQRQLQREQRHRDRVERDRLRPSSPPPIVHFSEHEAAAIAEKLKQDEFFPKACQTLITWLDRGDCNKKNSNTFYSMIQSTNPHIRRLLNEKSTYEEELNKAKESYRKQMQCLSTQRKWIDLYGFLFNLYTIVGWYKCIFIWFYANLVLMCVRNSNRCPFCMHCSQFFFYFCVTEKSRT